MTPTVANLNPAISLFFTNVSTPTQRRIMTCAIIARAVGTTTISAIRSHNGRLDRKCDTLAPPRERDGDFAAARNRSHHWLDRTNRTALLCRRLSQTFAVQSTRQKRLGV